MEHKIIDMHIHFGAPKDEQSGCYWSRKFETQPAYYAMLLITKSLFKKVNIKRVRKQLLKTINGSKFVEQGVLLAMDQVYDEQGTVHPEWTHMHTPNRYLAGLARENERVRFGASVHPYRKDWESELDFCLENGAVLCKWIPSSMQINPQNPKCRPFYKKLASHNLPLLCHAGPEYAIPTSNESYNEYNNPKYLREALDAGAPLIIAHCAMPYFWFLDRNYQDDFNDFLKLFKESEGKNWQLYADLSALPGPARAPYMNDVLESVPQERMLFGSDFPVPISVLSYNRSKDFISWLRFIVKVVFMKNALDKNYLLIKNMGIKDEVFQNAGRLFSHIKIH